MKPEKTKLYLEQLKQFKKQEKLLIDSGAVYKYICSQMLPVSDVAIAADLEITVPGVRMATKQLSEDLLIMKNYQGDWVLNPDVEF